MPFLLTTLASLSTLVGAIIILFIKEKKDNILVLSLSFAAGVMSAVSFTDLIKEALELYLLKYHQGISIIFVLFYINIGIVLSMTIDKLLKNIENKIYKVGIVSMIAIIFHNIPEGIVTFITSDMNLTLGITLTLAIAAHNIPEGITIAVPIYYASNSKKKALFCAFVSGISELFGAIIAFIILKPIITYTILGNIYAIIAGIMLYIAFYELLPTAISYKKNKLVFYSFLIGWGIILLNHFLLN